jgi:hypothetical protein
MMQKTWFDVRQSNGTYLPEGGKPDGPQRSAHRGTLLK